ncbi:MAG: demethoxyubiquinone hydroxylase family protein [Gemmatimonadaceae bacterium]
MEQINESDAALAAELNDLLKLDHDAVQAYTLAIRLLENPEYKRQLEEFRADHQRHIDELSQLIRSRDATPLELPHLPSGAFKLAVQAIGGAGGDRAVLLAFKANERQVRDKYRRSARTPHAADVTSVLARAADDESRHYSWALETLEEMGVTPDTVTGRAERAFEVAHARAADVMESAERQAMLAVQGAGRTLRDDIINNPISSALLAVGVGFVAATLFGGARSVYHAISERDTSP